MPRALFLISVLFGAFGCGSEPPSVGSPAPASSAPALEGGAGFRHGESGGIIGSVTWTGAIPVVEPVADVRPRPDGTGYTRRVLSHPYAPRIDRASYALLGAVVYLRNVDPARAKPWAAAPVRVEFRDAQIVVTPEGGEPGRVGFVRRGAAVSFRSADPVFNTLRGRGAAFFAIPFPDPDQALERTFDAPGRIELTSASGYHWQAADLFVCEHSYFTLSGPDGRFELSHVPEGTYELVAWHPNWNTVAHERNPESGLVQRVRYAPPLETVRTVTVTRGQSAFAPVNLSPPK
ncbi:hypothetical protein GobsT_40090 [Gemmata obscuriglobus]|uniref:hypothetical protein n=1 Tax=Gemmata obscuriglobus TaxID=114 RepID=UPI0011CD2E63|nr:hypothetical protein [Gemmata obscuriglobus]QEG29219.1 hypothetical protein GobsT_40090 [Gemmata obscuriglobus]VTS08015.1 collagen-binding protein : Putative lipoprotein OS=Anaeromyxobacter sp. (strain Fw109-5) GN=Anae109_2853 PE=4 SV=1 [Gemmata obscuriglobus UQM 2246]